MADLYKELEEMNKDYINILNSKEYRLGGKIIKIIKLLFSLKIRSIIIEIDGSIKKRRIKRYNKVNKINDYDYIGKYEEIHKIPKIAVYTCVTGGYDNIFVPKVFFENVDYYLLTDNVNFYKKYDSYFRIIEISNNLDSICKNRYAKFHPHNYFNEYDYSIYVDGNIEVISDIRDFCIKSNTDTGLAMHRHRERICLYDEAKVCNIYKRGNARKILEQIKKYKSEKMPSDYGLLEANVIVCNLKNSISKKIFDDWWNDFIEKESYRDQLSLPYILWKNGIQVKDIGNLGNNVYQNYKLRINKHN